MSLSNKEKAIILAQQLRAEAVLIDKMKVNYDLSKNLVQKKIDQFQYLLENDPADQHPDVDFVPDYLFACAVHIKYGASLFEVMAYTNQAFLIAAILDEMKNQVIEHREKLETAHKELKLARAVFVMCGNCLEKAIDNYNVKHDVLESLI